MLSCGSKGGTVGPHTDHYDVFLIQVKGQRKWSYGTNKIYDPEIIPELDLKLMSQFDADETHILNPGDVLYIPPEVAHYGVAKSDDCVTCSIGMRTPSHSELMTSFIDHLAQEKSDNSRFEEPQFDKQPQIGEITSKDIDNISQILIENLNSEKKSLSDWFGQYITEYRSLFFEFNQYQDINNLSIEHDLQLSAFSKSCYFVNKDNADMFVNGQKFQSSLSLALAVCDDKIVTKSKLNKLSNNEQSIINTLFENGSLIQNLK